MDLNGVEGIAFHALGGADNIVINDVTGTDLSGVAIDLEGTCKRRSNNPSLKRPDLPVAPE